jgi:hypothetical protein
MEVPIPDVIEIWRVINAKSPKTKLGFGYDLYAATQD